MDKVGNLEILESIAHGLSDWRKLAQPLAARYRSLRDRAHESAPGARVGGTVSGGRSGWRDGHRLNPADPSLAEVPIFIGERSVELPADAKV